MSPTPQPATRSESSAAGRFGGARFPGNRFRDTPLRRLLLTRAFALALGFAAASTAGLACASAAETGPRVLAAISLKEVLDDLARAWVAQGGSPP